MIFKYTPPLQFHTPVYGIARSLLALNLIFELVFTNANVYFPNGVVTERQGLGIPNFFELFGSISILLSIVAMIIVITGFLPQITSIIHAWIAYSFFTGSFVVEGGNQVAQILTLLLIPIALSDRRINHWYKKDFFKYSRPEWLDYLVWSFLKIIQLQMAIIYFFAVAVKVNHSNWQDGSAFYYWFNHNAFGANEKLIELLSPLVNNPVISPMISWGALLVETFLFAAIFMSQKAKNQLFWIGLGFHFMIIIVHGLWSFFFAMAGGLVLYLLPANKPLKSFSALLPRVQ